MKQIKKIVNKLRLAMIMVSLFAMYNIPMIAAAKTKASPTPSGGGSIEGSKIVTGTTSMFNDISSALLILAPVVGGALLGYNFFKAAHAEEEEMRSIKKQRKNIIFCTVGVFLASIIITVVTGYYK